MVGSSCPDRRCSRFRCSVSKELKSFRRKRLSGGIRVGVVGEVHSTYFVGSVCQNVLPVAMPTAGRDAMLSECSNGCVVFNYCPACFVPFPGCCWYCEVLAAIRYGTMHLSVKVVAVSDAMFWFGFVLVVLLSPIWSNRVSWRLDVVAGYAFWARENVFVLMRVTGISFLRLHFLQFPPGSDQLSVEGFSLTNPVQSMSTAHRCLLAHLSTECRLDHSNCFRFLACQGFWWWHTDRYSITDG